MSLVSTASTRRTTSITTKPRISMEILAGRGHRSESVESPAYRYRSNYNPSRANIQNPQHTNQSDILNDEEKFAFQEENLYDPTDERPTHVHRASDPFRTTILSIRSPTPTTQSLLAYHTKARDNFSLTD